MSRSIVQAARKEMRPLLRDLLAQGWTLVLTRKNHIRATSPDGGAPVYMPLTPGSRDIARQVLPRLRRAGYIEGGE